MHPTIPTIYKSMESRYVTFIFLFVFFINFMPTFYLIFLKNFYYFCFIYSYTKVLSRPLVLVVLHKDPNSHGSCGVGVLQGCP